MKPGDIYCVQMLGYDEPWRCRIASKRVSPVGSILIEWLDGPLAGRPANIGKEFLREWTEQ